MSQRTNGFVSGDLPVAGDLPVTGDTITFGWHLNGEESQIEVDPAERLLDTLRYRLGLTGTKEGCAEGECGSCTVLMDGIPVNSCLVLSIQAAGRRIETVESLDEAALAPFLEGGATQCGACTPGVVITANWLLANRDLLDTHRIRELMAGNLCRCTGYDGIIDSIEAALGADGAEDEGGEGDAGNAGDAGRAGDAA